jgi:hypothetical protein
MHQITREQLADGSLKLVSGHCSFTFRRPRAGVLHVVIAGEDTGQFGPAVLDQLRAAIDRDGRIELFVDAYDGSTTTQAVTDAWKQFFAAQRGGLSAVHVLVGSKFMYLNVAITQHLAGADRLVRIYTDRAAFQRAGQLWM